jgi:hypothetical protein
MRRASSARLETTNPMPQGERVVLAQALHVAHLKATFLGRFERGADGHESAVRKDVAANKGRTAPVCLCCERSRGSKTRRLGGAGDRLAGRIPAGGLGPHARTYPR